MKRVLYTVLSGGYDELEPIANKAVGVDYIVVSDDDIFVPDGWRLMKIPRENGESSLEYNRKYKILPQLLFDDYDSSIYIDANIIVKNDVSYLYSELESSTEFFLAYEHPVRKSLYEEANVLKNEGFDNFYRINKQVKHYYKEGYIDTNFFEANILIREHCPKLYLIMECWFSHFKNGVRRDQLSLVYAFWSNNERIKSLGEHDARFVNKTFHYKTHSKKTSHKRMLNKIINRAALFSKLDKFINYG
ncbi:hypothetical protein A3K86_13210 [Photobacterium jeanii]|uniref:TOD1/MUCI70 glycosyltransferase-like domain-containing protein n=2 Tax=Photobacterium jeanii TaxID=858640 RepID=A0A178K8A2_9GAMM|nr:hypothetical protein A3K86_13210 [Photobacterium jeanii]